MKNLSLFLVALVAAIAAALLTHLLLDSPKTASEAPGDWSQRLAALEKLANDSQADREELSKALTALQQRLDLQSGPAPARTTSAGDLDAAVARWMEQHQGGALASEDPVASAGDADGLTVEGAMDQLLNPSLSWDQREAVWKKIRDSGMLDAVIAEMEARAAANPGSAELQLALGDAYLQPIFTGKGGPEAGEWATKADHAFDRALAINPQYWDARFSKAVSLSFWPAVLGKQGEAIHQFEVLLDQQGGSSVRPEFAQTYMFLGNLYQQTGRGDRALEVWNQGLALYPDSADLRSQVDNSTPH